MANVVKTVIQFRRDTTANWLTYKDIVPAPGEPCYDLQLKTLKIGDGTTTYENLPAIGGAEISADGSSIAYEGGVFTLFGFDTADAGSTPCKNADGVIEWAKVPSQNDIEKLQENVSGLQTDVETMQEILFPVDATEGTLLSRVETLETQMNGTEAGSVDAKINTKIDEFVANVSNDGVINTFKELVDYVASHGPEAADMAADISTLQKLVGDTSVSEQILAVVNSSGHVAENKAKAIFESVKYEISSKPAGTLVDYSDKEIRVMCPADTQWQLQNVGEGGNGSLYYIGVKAYAPDGAVSFKEDLAEVIADDEMYYFENNDFAGVDEFGRKYSIIWLPVAIYDADTDSWSYYGAKSSAGKYIGWYYSVEWYNADGKKFDSDIIRINLSNESCHNAIEPFYTAGLIKEIAVNGSLLDVVDGRVNIAIAEQTLGVKSSEEVIVAEDGTLSIGKISFSKIVQEEDENIVLDGGAAAG